LYGALFVTAFGFVRPENSATTSSPHEFEDNITRTSLLAAAPLVVHVNDKSQLAVNVQAAV
jgi:hypothetical protein